MTPGSVGRRIGLGVLVAASAVEAQEVRTSISGTFRQSRVLPP